MMTSLIHCHITHLILHTDMVLLVGTPSLSTPSSPVTDVDDPTFVSHMDELEQALETFREANGFGRAIAAPQIGYNQRFISLHLGPDAEGFDGLAPGPFTIINPVIEWKSDSLITLWDDCMSHPDILVRVQRSSSISISFTDASGNARTADHLPPSISELLQHEIDHLDGILALDRALPPLPALPSSQPSSQPSIPSFVARSVYDASPDRFASMVDYTITPTITPTPTTA